MLVTALYPCCLLPLRSRPALTPVQVAGPLPGSRPSGRLSTILAAVKGPAWSKSTVMVNSKAWPTDTGISGPSFWILHGCGTKHTWGRGTEKSRNVRLGHVLLRPSKCSTR
jgi:hypothetical protein